MSNPVFHEDSKNTSPSDAPPQPRNAEDLDPSFAGACSLFADPRIKRQFIASKNCLGLVAAGGDLPKKTVVLRCQAVVQGETRRARLIALLEAFLASGKPPSKKQSDLLVQVLNMACVDGVCAQEMTPAFVDELRRKYLHKYCTWLHHADPLLRDVCGVVSVDGSEKVPDPRDVTQLFDRFLHSLMDILGTNDHGAGLWIEAAYPNHGCKPNARFETCDAGHRGSNGSGAAVKQVVTVRPVSCGEEIVVSYTDKCLKNTEHRRRFLQKQWGFWCQCESCLAGVR